MKRVAAVDCGTNSIRLLIVDLDPATGGADEVRRSTTIVRLGEGVDRTGEFAPAALTRTFAALDRYAAEIRAASVDAVRFVATSAARDVSNRDALVDGVRQRLGVDAEVITGDEEARLSYDGATRALSAHEIESGEPIARPVVVIDIGGGSTEFVSRAGDSGPVRAQSLDLGSVRLTERHLTSDPPTADEIAAARGDVAAALDQLTLSSAGVGTAIGVAGTVTTVAAMALDLAVYDRNRLHLARLERGQLLTAVGELVAMSVAGRRGLGLMDPGRADVIGGGALIVAGIIDRLDLDQLVVSERDILDGIAWSLV